MKKFYTFVSIALLCGAVAVAQNSAEIANSVSVDIVAHKSIDTSKLGKLMTWEEVSQKLRSDETKATPTATLRATASSIAKAPAIAKAPVAIATIDDLLNNQWEGSYQGMLSSNSGAHEGEASFKYYEEYEELDLTLPDYNTDFYVGFADGALIVYGKVGYGSNANGDIVLCPINSATGAMLTSANVTVKYNEATGAFDFPENFAWGLCAVKNGTVAGFYWAAKNLNLKISEGDYRINAKLEEECTPDNKYKFTVNPGADVAEVKAMLLAYDGDPTEHAEFVKTFGFTVKPGETYTVDPVKDHALVSSEGPMTESGHASVIFASYDANGNVMKTQSFSMIVVLENEEGWNNIGEITYTDQLFAQYYNNFAHSQQAMLQEKEDAPGFYRLVNPYSELKIHNADCAHYFMIDARDKEWVTIPFSVSGLDLGGDGILAFGTAAALGYGKEDGQAEGLSSGKMEGQTITFPVKSIFCHEQNYDKPGSWSYFNASTAATISLPDITLDVTVADANNNPVENATVRLVDSNTEVQAFAEESDILTDAEGKASLIVPFSTGYFGKVTLAISKADGEIQINDSKEIALNGAKNTFSYVAGNTSGIDDIIADDSAKAPVEYYNLQGIQVESPTNGLYIKKEGSKVSKVIIR